MSYGNTPYGLSGEISDRAAQTLDGVHLGGIMEQGDVGGNLKRFGLVPSGSVTAEQNMIFRKSACKFAQGNVHTIAVAVGHDQKEAFSRKRLYGAVSIAVFADVKAGNVRADAFCTSSIWAC